jgi:predicted Zn-dependent protease
MTASQAETTADPAREGSLFEQALQRYQEGAPVAELIGDFETITRQSPGQSAGWTCLAWLQLLADQPMAALRSARQAVKLSPQDPQARINLSLAMLETGAKGVREHIEIVKRVTALAPELAGELTAALDDGLQRRPGWGALEKVKAWLGP